MIAAFQLIFGDFSCHVQAAQYHLTIEGDLLAYRLILGRLQGFLNCMPFH